MKKTIMLALALVAGLASAEFKAGFARVDATPPLGIPIVGYFHKRVADGVKCLFLNAAQGDAKSAAR